MCFFVLFVLNLTKHLSIYTWNVLSSICHVHIIRSKSVRSVLHIAASILVVYAGHLGL